MTTSPSSIGSVRVSSAEFLPPTKLVKTCVVKEGTREPWTRITCSTSSASSSIVAPGRTFGATAAIVSSQTRQARCITSSSSASFVRRSSFTSGGAGDGPLGPQGLLEVEHGLGPRAVADRERARLTAGPRRLLEQRMPVVALAHDDELARQLLADVEQRHHPRQDEDGVPPGRKKAPATQPCAYCDWPNVGIPRSTPVRYSRSEDGGRKSVSTPASRIRSSSRRLRSA